MKKIKFFENFPFFIFFFLITLNPFEDSSDDVEQKLIPQAAIEPASDTSSSMDNPFEATGEKHGYEQVAENPDPTLGEDMRRRQEDLDRRERELREREKALGIDAARPKNWPRCYPFTHMSISSEIPATCRSFVRLAYIAWIFGIIFIIWNLVCALAKLGAKSAQSTGNDIALAVVYVVVLPYLSYKLWFRLVYNASKKNSGAKFFLFFIDMGIWICFCIFMMIGLTGAGTIGIINTIDLKNEKTQVYLNIANIVGWFIEFVLCIFVFKGTNSFYRGSGLVAQQQNTVSVLGAV